MNKDYFLYLTVFVTGAVILVLEILGTRILAPYYGTTIYVWSSLIGVALIALAIGYSLGGKFSDQFPRGDNLYYILFLAAIFIFIIPLLKNVVLRNTEFLGIKYGALLSAGLLFSIPLLLLGMVAPYAIKIKTKKLDAVGVSAGTLYGVATIGSFVGAIVTGFYLIQTIGINTILLFLGGALCLLSLAWFASKKRISVMLTILVCVLFFLLVNPSSAYEPGFDVLYEKESPYARIKVIENSFVGLRGLFVDGATHTEYNLTSGEFTLPYLQLFEKSTQYSDAQEILVIGLGGGGVDKTLESYSVNITSVEIDPVIIDAARQYFNYTGNAVLDDGRHYIRNTDKKYDVVFLDVYGGYSIYPYLFSKEAFKEIKNILSQDGILVINAIGYEQNFTTEDKLILSIYKTLKEEFSNIQVKTIKQDLTNFAFYATDSNFTIQDDEFISIDLTRADLSIATLITDDFNPIDMYSRDSAKEWVEMNIEIFGGALV